LGGKLKCNEEQEQGSGGGNKVIRKGKVRNIARLRGVHVPVGLMRTWRWEGKKLSKGGNKVEKDLKKVFIPSLY